MDQPGTEPGTYEGTPPRSVGMTREQQTAIIVGVMVALFAIAAIFYFTRPDEKYPTCTRWDNVMNTKCVLDESLRRLNGGLLPSEEAELFGNDAAADVDAMRRGAEAAAEAAMEE